MKINKIKISQLPEAETLKGFSTIGVDSDNRSCRADLGFIEQTAQTAWDIANHPTMIDNDNYVYKWDTETRKYVKTGIYVKGDAGASAYESYAAGGGDPSVTETEFNRMLAGLPELTELLSNANSSLENRLNGK